MGLNLTHRINEGIHITGNGESFDIILREVVCGSRVNKSVRLEAKGIQRQEDIILIMDRRYVRVTEGLFVRLGAHQKSGQRAKIEYDGDKEVFNFGFRRRYDP